MQMKEHGPKRVNDPPVIGCSCGWVGLTRLPDDTDGIDPGFEEWLSKHFNSVLAQGFFHGSVAAAVARDLLSAWETMPRFYWRSNNVRLMALAWGWWTIVNRAGHAVFVLFNTGHSFEAIPLLRSMFEHTLFLNALVVGGEDAFDATFHEHWRHSNKIWQSAKGGPMDPVTRVFPIPTSEDAPPNPSEAKWTQGIKSICDRFGSSDSLYVLYRVLSGLTHPSFGGARHFLGDMDSIELGPIRQPDVEIESDMFFWAACLLIWAGQAFQQFTIELPIARQIDEAAAKLGIPSFGDFSSSTKFGAVNVTKDQLYEILFPGTENPSPDEGLRADGVAGP
jgi:hypothetical protein